MNGQNEINMLISLIDQGYKQKDIAKMLGITEYHVSLIVNGKLKRGLSYKTRKKIQTIVQKTIDNK